MSKRKKIEKYPMMKTLGIILAVIALLASAFFVWQIMKLGFVPQKYINYLIYAAAGVNLFLLLIALVVRNLLPIKLLNSLLCIVVSVAMVFGCLMIPKYKGKAERIFNPIPETTELHINIYALKDSGYQEIKDVLGKEIGLQNQFDAENQQVAIADINKYLSSIHLQEFTETREYEDIYSLVEGLYAGDSEIIMMNDLYAGFISDNADFSSFEDDVVILYTVTYDVVNEHSSEEYHGDITKDPFVVGICGVDASGRLNDVNMVLMINPTTRQLLIVTIPRDAYIPLQNDPNKMDKLTHTGWLGQDAWEMALEYILDTNIDFYGKVGFDSLVTIVDAIGGVDIYNPYAFSSTSYYFPEGNVHLYGDKALNYCRERYHLPDGDEGRNKHQAIVLEAIIKKLTSSAILSHVDSFMDSIAGLVTTDITMDQIYKLIGMQLNDMRSWKISRYSITGKGFYTYSYMLGRSSGPRWYMNQLSESKITEAKNLMKKVANGETLK